MSAALAIVEESTVEEAVRQTVRLVVIEAAAAAEGGTAVLASDAAVGTAVAAGEVTVVAATLSTVLVATGVGAAVIGVAALGYYLYTQHEKPKPNSEVVQSCPKATSSIASPGTALSSPAQSTSIARTAGASSKGGNCDPGDCDNAKETIRDVLKGGRTEKRPLEERLEDLRRNEEGQPYDYPVDPLTGKQYPSEGGTIKGHLDAIINQQIRANEAIQIYYSCGCAGLADSEIRELGDLLAQDPLEGIQYRQPNYRTPAERDAYLRRIGKRP